MQNPQKVPNLSPQTIYQYQTHQNIPWNIAEYQPVREYVDPVKQIEERKLLQVKKGQPSNKHITKRGFYMDYHLKVVKAIPAPTHYQLKDPFDQNQSRKKAKSNKLDKSLSKLTYIDQIELEQKNRKKPGPGSYNLRKTQKQINQELTFLKSKKTPAGEKRFFYQDFQHLSQSVPGMGQYNPHLQVKTVRADKKDHKFWIEKHMKQSKSFQKKRLSEPDPGSYSPCPLNIATFDRIKSATQRSRKKKDTKNTGFGTDPKFPYQRASKIKIKQKRPSPSAYNTMIQWKGKHMDAKKNNWVRSVSTGFSEKIY